MSSASTSRLAQRVLSKLREYDRSKWERILETMLSRLELSKPQLERAIVAYGAIARHLAEKLETPLTDVHIIPQGSMRTQTTVRPRGNVKFDLDIVTKLEGATIQRMSYDQLFEAVGLALSTLPESTGKLERKNRCWRVQMPNEDFYFDVTPALPDPQRVTGAALKVPDNRRKGWSPSNPVEFAAEFCRVAALRFQFQAQRETSAVFAGKQVDPLPTERVPLDDILRRTIQLMKLHRDNFYWQATDRQKDEQPISVIICTLAMKAYERIWASRGAEAHSIIEVVLAVIDMMPDLIAEERRDGKYFVRNPALSSENFADRWNEAGSTRAYEFMRWHGSLEHSVELLLQGEATAQNKDALRTVFGEAGVDAFVEAQENSFLGGLLATPAGTVAANPTRPVPSGKSHSLA